MFEQSAGGRAESGRWPPRPAGPRPRHPAACPAARHECTGDGISAKAAEPERAADANKHLDAISAILDQSKTGALTKAQTDELKKHVAELRALLNQRR